MQARVCWTLLTQPLSLAQPTGSPCSYGSAAHPHVPTRRGYAFQMEVAARAQAAGLSIAEVPIVFVDRLYGTSKLGPGEFAGFLAGLARLLLAL